MSDTPEMNVWTFEGCSTPSEIRSAEYAKGYQAAIDDVVKWLGEQYVGRLQSPIFLANEIASRFGKDA